YGCSVGADQAFLAGLAGVTGADVAASTDPTGNGDWDLEAAVGAIEAAPFALAYGGILDATLSGEPDFVEQGPSTILPDLDELLGSLPPEVIGGGEGQGPTDTDSTPPVNAGSLITGMEAQGNPLAGAITSVVVSPADPNTIFIGTVNGGVWVTRDASATKDVDVNTITDPQRGTAPKKPALDSQAVAAGAQLEARTYEYKVTFYDSETHTESNASETFIVEVAAAGSKVKLKNLELGPEGTTARFIYRREAGTDHFFRKIGEVSNTASVKTTFEDLGAPLTDANKARIQKVAYPHWEPLTDGWESLAITTLAFDVGAPMLDGTTLLSAIGPNGVRTIGGEAGYDFRAILRDGTTVNVSLEAASRIDDVAAILEVEGGYLASGQPKITLTIEDGKRLVLTDNTQPFVITPVSGLAAFDLGLTQLADAATGKNIVGAARSVALSEATLLADIGATGVRTTAGTNGKHLHVTLSNGSPAFDVDLTGALTLADVFDKIKVQSRTDANDANSWRVSGSVEAGSKIVLTEKTPGRAGSFAITNSPSANAGTDLGIAATGAAGKITSTDRTVYLSEATRLADLNSGSGVRARGGASTDYDFTIHLNSGQAPFAVKVGGPQTTVGQLLAALGALGGGGKIEASVGARGLPAEANRILLKDLTAFASPFEVENPDNSQALADLGFTSLAPTGKVLKSDNLTTSLPNNQTIYAGTGNASSSRQGGEGIGLLKSSDNGVTWSLKGETELAGKKITSIVTTYDAGQHVLLVGTRDGLYRSVDGGDHFQRIRAGDVTDLKTVRDPAHPTTNTLIFAAFVGEGVYRSDGDGVAWTRITAASGA